MNPTPFSAPLTAFSNPFRRDRQSLARPVRAWFRTSFWASFRAFRFLIFLLLAAPAMAAPPFLHGEVTYSGRTLPPAGSELVVTLETAPAGNTPPAEIASMRMQVSGRPPYDWRLYYDPASVEGIQPVLRARIKSGEKVWMKTEQGYPAFAAAGSKKKKPQQLVLRSTRVADASLQGTRWALTHLGGQAVPPAADPVGGPHLVLYSDGRMTGSDGCNPIIGGNYVFDRTRLRFGSFVEARRACSNLEGRDLALRRALEAVTAWRVEGKLLELLAGTQDVARFNAMPLY
jgi:uncharacterized lipoprotein YbaY